MNIGVVTGMNFICTYAFAYMRAHAGLTYSIKWEQKWPHNVKNQCKVNNIITVFINKKSYKYDKLQIHCLFVLV